MKERAILLMNLGSPDSYETTDVKTYLKEFLMDKRVINAPYLLRSILVNGIITPARAPKSAEKYKTVWTDEGSPLIVITEKLTEAVKAQTGLAAEMCMRYANPTPEAALNKLQKDHPNLKEVILFPLYPHYAMSSYETAVEYAKDAYKKGNYTFKLEVVKPYYNHPAYISALAKSIKPHLNNDYDQLLFSYHGIPERHVRLSDPTGNHCLKSGNCCQEVSPAHDYCYRHQVFTTTELVKKELGLEDNKCTVSFQSRLGRDKWLKPFTAELLQEYPKQGVKKIVVVCPAFVSDCLETLEEMDMEGKETFLESGGESFTRIPCLNTDEQWVDAIQCIIEEY